MGIGNRIFGTNRLLTSNCVVDIEKEAASAAGGTVLTWSVLTSAVDVLVTLTSGTRDFAAGGLTQRDSFVVSGVESTLDRPDTRLKVVTFPDDTTLVGRYLSVDAVTSHPAGRGGLLAKRITLQCSVLDTPATALS